MPDDASAGDSTAPTGSREDGTGAPGHPSLGPDEQALLAAFDRLEPQGSLQWGFDNAMGRITAPPAVPTPGAAPWKGLPDDLWNRGRSARIGQRFVGDVARVLADTLAADARAATSEVVAGFNVATWDALRYLAARVELLEARHNPARLEAAELETAPPDLSEWTGQVDTWLGTPDPSRAVIVGESGDGTLLRALLPTGRRMRGVEPRGASVWSALAEPGSGAAGGPAPPPDVVLGEMSDHLAVLAPASAGGVVLVGCVDRLDLAGKVGLVAEAVRVVRSGGSLVVLATDHRAWDEALPVTARDLLPGRPLHPETWLLLLGRLGVTDLEWHRPSSGTVHAVVGVVA
jgi:hypothetical protein